MGFFDRSSQRPADADPTRLEALRQQSLEAHGLNRDVHGFNQYEQESHYTPQWLCPCERLNECAETTCAQCGDERPPILHGDPAQGDSMLGLARRIARNEFGHLSQLTRDDLMKIAKWRSTIHNYSIDEYRFDSGSRNDHRKLRWREYVEYLLEGGSV